eukprot:2172107-Alexandrium_andersonii.AAC.1
MSHSQQANYIHRVCNDNAYRRAEGLLGRFVEQPEAGRYMPWDWSEVVVSGQGGLPGLEAYQN